MRLRLHMSRLRNGMLTVLACSDNIMLTCAPVDFRLCLSVPMLTEESCLKMLTGWRLWPVVWVESSLLCTKVCLSNKHFLSFCDFCRPKEKRRYRLLWQLRYAHRLRHQCLFTVLPQNALLSDYQPCTRLRTKAFHSNAQRRRLVCPSKPIPTQTCFGVSDAVARSRQVVFIIYANN